MPSDYDVTRRQFAKSAAAFAAMVGMSNLEVPDLVAAPNGGGAVNWGMIGTGTRGMELLRQLSKTPIGRCTALCDIYPVNLKKGLETIGGDPAPYEDYRRLLERKDLDAVLIATPLHLHARMVLDALDAGKHVFVEKVMVFKEEEIQQVKDAVAAHPKQVLQVGLQRRYSLVYRLAMEMIRKSGLGKVTHVRACWHRNGNWRRNINDPNLERQINWRMYREYSGGLMAELGSHQTDIANWAIGAEPRSVIGFGGIDYWKDGRETFDNAQCLYEYPGGQKLIYSSITTNGYLSGGGGRPSEEIMGDAGTLILEMDGASGKGMYFREPKAKVTQGSSKEQWWAGATVSTAAAGEGVPIFPEQPATDQSFVQRELSFAKRWLARKGWYDVEEPRDPVFNELEHFLLCVRDGLKPVADVNVGASDAECVIYANRAMQDERRVYWPKYEQKPAAPRKASTATGKQA